MNPRISPEPQSRVAHPFRLHRKGWVIVRKHDRLFYPPSKILPTHPRTPRVQPNHPPHLHQTNGRSRSNPHPPSSLRRHTLHPDPHRPSPDQLRTHPMGHHPTPPNPNCQIHPHQRSQPNPQQPPRHPHHRHRHPRPRLRHPRTRRPHPVHRRPHRGAPSLLSHHRNHPQQSPQRCPSLPLRNRRQTLVLRPRLLDSISRHPRLRPFQSLQLRLGLRLRLPPRSHRRLSPFPLSLPRRTPQLRIRQSRSTPTTRRTPAQSRNTPIHRRRNRTPRPPLPTRHLDPRLRVDRQPSLRPPHPRPHPRNPRRLLPRRPRRTPQSLSADLRPHPPHPRRKRHPRRQLSLLANPLRSHPRRRPPHRDRHARQGSQPDHDRHGPQDRNARQSQLQVLGRASGSRLPPGRHPRNRIPPQRRHRNLCRLQRRAQLHPLRLRRLLRPAPDRNHLPSLARNPAPSPFGRPRPRRGLRPRRPLLWSGRHGVLRPTYLQRPRRLRPSRRAQLIRRPLPRCRLSRHHKIRPHLSPLGTRPLRRRRRPPI